ncbi:MAG: peptide-methionine (S)-S-oxide reductase MsrA [Candidatus Woykebacteria bacterium]
METTTLAAGCFWCTEAIFKRLKGVESVVSGYSGGDMENPSYHRVSEGTTGHAEAIQIKFDPKIISYEKLLEVFFKLHDPTSKNQQGADIGTQYRSMVFYHDEGQRKVAEKVKEDLNSKAYQGKIVTEIAPFKNFFPAEGYHQEYYEKNRTAGYCTVVIDPKITKLYKEFGEDVKEEYKK